MRLLHVLGLALFLAVGIAGLLHVLEDEPESAARQRGAGLRVPTRSGRDPAVQESPSKAAHRPLAAPSAGSDGDSELATWNDAGLAALEAGDHAVAVASFERCLAARPNESVYAASLAEALARFALDEYGNGARTNALVLLERAGALAPERDDIAKILARWREIQAEEKALWQYETDHFELAFDAEREDLLYGAQDVLDVLESAYHEFGLKFDFDLIRRRRQRVRVILSDHEDFRRVTGLGEWAGGAFDGTIRLPLSDLANEQATWEPVLRHELVHVFVHESGKKYVPGWLNEGLAQWLEGNREELLTQARRTMAGAEPFPLQELKGSLSDWEDPAAIRRAYAQALLFVDGIARTYGEEVLVKMVAGCVRGGNPGLVFEARTGISLATVFADMEF